MNRASLWTTVARCFERGARRRTRRIRWQLVRVPAIVPSRPWTVTECSRSTRWAPTTHRRSRSPLSACGGCRGSRFASSPWVARHVGGPMVQVPPLRVGLDADVVAVARSVSETNIIGTGLRLGILGRRATDRARWRHLGVAGTGCIAARMDAVGPALCSDAVRVADVGSLAGAPWSAPAAMVGSVCSCGRPACSFRPFVVLMSGSFAGLDHAALWLAGPTPQSMDHPAGGSATVVLQSCSVGRIASVMALGEPVPRSLRLP